MCIRPGSSLYRSRTVGLPAFVILWFALFPQLAMAQGSLINGGNHSGSISVPGQLHEWTFTAAQGDFVALSTAEVEEISGRFAPWIRLVSPSGSVVGASWGDLAAQINLNLPASGTYTVIVGSNTHPSIPSNITGTGIYRLTLAKVPGAFVVPPGDHGGPLTNGENHPGSIPLGDLDLWTFAAAQGDFVALSIAEVEEISGRFAPWIRLVSPSGSVVGASWGDLAAQINLNLPASGTYTVIVGSNTHPSIPSVITGTGTYRLTLAKVPGAFVVPPGDHGGPLTNGENHPGSIPLGDLDLWTFTAAQGDFVALSIAEVEEISGRFAPWIRLVSPSGSVVGASWGDLAAQINLSIPASGTYTVVVGSNTHPSIPSVITGTGTYRLTLAKVPGAFVVPPGDHGGPLTNGEDHPGSIPLGDLDLWTFTAAQGDFVALSITEVEEISGRFAPWIRLVSPSGSVVGASWGDLAAQINLNIPASGTYTVVVGSNTHPSIPSVITGTGHYLVKVLGATDVTTFTVTPSSGPNGTISPSTPQTVTSGATVAFTLTPATGHVIQSVGGTCGGTLTGQVFTTAAVTANCTVVANFAPATAGPTMSLDKSALYFAAVTDGVSFLSQTSAQIVRLTQSGAGTVTWTAVSNQPWLTVSPMSGSGSADLSIAVAATGGLPIGGSVKGFITLSLTGAGNTAGPIEIVLTTLAPGTSENPFGVIDTPFDHGTGISGAVPFTGWGSTTSRSRA